MINETNIPIPLWKRLYEVSYRLFDLAPWNWMYEVDVFGIHDEYTDNLHYCSILGANYVEKGLAMYKGRSGFAVFEEQFKHLPESTYISDIIHQNCITLSFKDYNHLTATDRHILASCGYSLNQRDLFPVFRDFTPGLVPWRLEKVSQAMFLSEALEQVIWIAEHVKRDSDLLDYIGSGKSLLVRKSKREEDHKSWENEWVEVRPYIAAKPNIKINRIFLLSNLSNSTVQSSSWLIDIFYFPNPLGGPKERPYYPQMLIAVDIETGRIIGHDLFKPKELLESLQVRLVEIFKRIGHKPRKIYIPTFETYLMLEDIMDVIGIVLEIDEEMKLIDEIKSSIFGSLSV